MSEQGDRPLLFLDVDGPLLPFGDGAPRMPASPGADTRLARINPDTGPRLAALPCVLVWATTWEEAANADLAPRLGLPPLPVVQWPEDSDAREREDRWLGLHWKTRSLMAWAEGRPFAWVDDEITDADRDWAAARHPAPALLHRVEPSRGLSSADFAVLEQWLRAIRDTPQ
ncbi:HAD domain-containing protein [Nocardiopsis coralliicola]